MTQAFVYGSLKIKFLSTQLSAPLKSFILLPRAILLFIVSILLLILDFIGCILTLNVQANLKIH